MPVSACDVLAAPAHTSKGENDSKSMHHAGSEDTLCEGCILSGPGPDAHDATTALRLTPAPKTHCAETASYPAPSPAPSVVTPCDELKMLYVASVM